MTPLENEFSKNFTQPRDPMTENNKILIIGASGRLGKALQAALQHEELETVLVGRSFAPDVGQGVTYASDDPVLIERLKGWGPNLVINLAAIWGKGVTQEQMLKTSYEMPLSLAEKIEGDGLRWIQADSYFNLYFDEFGIDKDFYSKTKRLFTENFREMFENFSLTQVLAPHLVGVDEAKNRLFGTLVSGHMSQKPFALGSGNQYVPFVAVSDAAEQLAWMTSKHFSSAGSLPERLQLKRMDCLTVQQINSRCARQLHSKESVAMLGAIPDSQHDFYHKVTSEFTLEELPEPQLSLDDIIRGVAEHRMRAAEGQDRC